MRWQDTTSYSQGKERIATTWTTGFGVFKLTITRSHIDYKGQWIARCDPFFNIRELHVDSKADAMIKAVQIARGFLMTALSDLNEVME